MLGKANPLAPPIELRMEGDHLVGTATFGAAYEGPPGCVHGGYVAAAFDEVLGSAQSLSGSPGMTAQLVVNYRVSHAAAHRAALRGHDGQRRRAQDPHRAGSCGRAQVLCAEAEGLFISIDFLRFADLKARRAERQTRSP